MTDTQQDIHIGFIGGGNMARSLAGGLIADGLPASAISIAEPDAARRESLAERFGVRVTSDNDDVARASDVIVLAVKPQVLAEVASALAPSLEGRAPLVVSIAAGVRSADVARWLGGGLPVVRAMPNTPALLGCGATALFAAKTVSDSHREQAERILRAAGAVTWVEDEALMDPVTALSGSGPAYFFLLMESMADAGAALGLSRDQSRLLVLETALGAARMAMESDEDIPALRRGVTSPGGTTEAALQTLEAGGFRELVRQAVEAATDRSRELARQLGGD
ncbi:MAG: pyrroline-5-carboxylate reductase [Gammaproteobacteria bacterium]